MGRMTRTLRYTCTNANEWYKVFDEGSYKKNRIKEIRLKFEESATADHFRYNHDGDTSNYNTSTSGVNPLRNARKAYVYVPTTAGQVIEIEVIYK